MQMKFANTSDTLVVKNKLSSCRSETLQFRSVSLDCHARGAGVTARRQLEFTTWRAVCRLPQVLLGQWTKEVSCAGLRGRVLGAGGAPGGAALTGTLTGPPCRTA
jgi:hypothetical protein